MTTPAIIVEASVREVDIDLIAVGNEVLIDDDSGSACSGTIVEVADQSGGSAGDGRYLVLIEPDEDAGYFVGFSLRIEIPVSSTDGPVLTVPISALSARADGSSIVEVIDDATGESRLVTVQPGLTADGDVELVPVDGSLAHGDQVVVAGGAAPAGDTVTDDNRDGGADDSDGGADDPNEDEGGDAPDDDDEG